MAHEVSVMHMESLSIFAILSFFCPFQLKVSAGVWEEAKVALVLPLMQRTANVVCLETTL